MTARRRRPPGEGSVFEYRTKAGDDPVRDQVRRPGRGRAAPPGDAPPRCERPAVADPPGRRDALREAIVKAGKGSWIEPSKQPVGEYLATWLDGLRLAPGTMASYRKNVRLHVVPYIGVLPLASLTSARLTALYRELENSGRRDQKGERTGLPLSARTVRYVATMLGAALAAAVEDEVPLLARNPAVKAKPPTAKEAKAPEMHPWDADQLGAFLDWSGDHSRLHARLARAGLTGMRRGELLALRWRDVDLDAGTISHPPLGRHSQGQGADGQLSGRPTKTCRPRVIDLDPATAAVLRAWKSERGALALQLARGSSVVFGNREGGFRHPETFSKLFGKAQERCARTLGEDALPRIRLHDLRHTHATLLLRDRESPNVVSERLGHASVTVTLSIYAHVLPGDQKAAAARFAALVRGAEA